MKNGQTMQIFLSGSAPCVQVQIFMASRIFVFPLGRAEFTSSFRFGIRLWSCFHFQMLSFWQNSIIHILPLLYTVDKRHIYVGTCYLCMYVILVCIVSFKGCKKKIHLVDWHTTCTINIRTCLSKQFRLRSKSRYSLRWSALCATDLEGVQLQFR